MDSTLLFEPLMSSSQTNLNNPPSNSDSDYLHECKSHPKKKIFMFCMNHDSGICSDCWNSSDDYLICSRSNKDCNPQPIENYIR